MDPTTDPTVDPAANAGFLEAVDFWPLNMAAGRTHSPAPSMPSPCAPLPSFPSFSPAPYSALYSAPAACRCSAFR